MAAKANLAHGLPLKPREAKQAFRRYIKANLNLDARGHRKSYREMAAEIGKPHTTIRNWTKAMFPKLYALMGSHDEPALEKPEDSPGSTSEEQAAAQVSYHLSQALAHSHGVKDPDARGHMIERATTVLNEMKSNAPFNSPGF
ncbi:hypothetical protein [Dongia deserti]|uniref:hypothetical protein n=1 Tax=Dongia deserti TaxID=2268030 RepID=UPI0013C49D01|nr:hypothetical protein [Dongia deserti]